MVQNTVEQTEATPSAESVSTQTVESKGSEAVSQETQPSQKAETVEVENSPASQTSQVDRRPPPSTFYEVRQLKKQIKQMMDLITKSNQTPKNQDPVKPAYDPKEIEIEQDKLLKDPIPYIRERDEKLLKRAKEELLKELRENEIPTFYNQLKSKETYETKAREAWKLIFPNLDLNSENSLEEIQTKDSNRFNAIQAIWDEWGMEHVFQNDPLKAAKKTLEIFESKNKEARINLLAPSKAAMGSSTSGSPIGGQKPEPSLDDLKKVKEKLEKQVTEDPSLWKDEKFMKQWNELKETLTK